MTAAIVVLALVTLQRLSELVIARRNTRDLLARGGIEHGSSHYPVMVALHGAWLIGLWVYGWNATVNAALLAAYVVLQVLRFWTLATIGRRWTTRILTVPDDTLVTTGPYRFLRHPNYAVVLLEVPLLPLVLGLDLFALVFGFLNVAMLLWRIRIEEQALHPYR
jgi:methyltransferase